MQQWDTSVPPCTRGGELLDHPVAIELAFDRVMQNVKADQSPENFLVFAFNGQVRTYRFRNRNGA